MLTLHPITYQFLKIHKKMVSNMEGFPNNQCEDNYFKSELSLFMRKQLKTSTEMSAQVTL